jgi:hypothetical protein
MREADREHTISSMSKNKELRKAALPPERTTGVADALRRRHGGRQSPWLSLNGRDRIADFGDTESPAGIHEFRKEQ